MKKFGVQNVVVIFVHMLSIVGGIVYKMAVCAFVVERLRMSRQTNKIALVQIYITDRGK